MKRIRMQRALWCVVLGLATSTAGADTTVNETKPAQPDGRVSISNVSGKVAVEGWDRDEVQVTGTMGDGVERLEFEVNGDDTRVKVIHPRRSTRNGSAHLTVRVPASSRLEVEVVSADVTVDNMHGSETDLEAVSGVIEVENCSGAIEAQTVSGRIEISGYATSLEAKTVSGRINLKGVSTEARAETISGSITVDGGDMEEFTANTVSGAITFTGGVTSNGEIDVETVNGAVTLNLKAPAYGEYTIETFNGKIRCDFGPEPTRKSKYGPGWELEFRNGDNNADIDVQSFNGGVTIKKID